MTSIRLMSGMFIGDDHHGSAGPDSPDCSERKAWRDELGRDYVRHIAMNGLAGLGRAIVETMGEALAAGVHEIGGGIYEVSRIDGETAVKRNGVVLQGPRHPSLVHESEWTSVMLDVIQCSHPILDITGR